MFCLFASVSVPRIVSLGGQQVIDQQVLSLKEIMCSGSLRGRGACMPEPAGDRAHRSITNIRVDHMYILYEDDT